jgi:hypothetical protein
LPRDDVLVCGLSVGASGEWIGWLIC